MAYKNEVEFVFSNGILSEAVHFFQKPTYVEGFVEASSHRPVVNFMPKPLMFVFKEGHNEVMAGIFTEIRTELAAAKHPEIASIEIYDHHTGMYWLLLKNRIVSLDGLVLTIQPEKATSKIVDSPFRIGYREMPEEEPISKEEQERLGLQIKALETLALHKEKTDDGQDTIRYFKEVMIAPKSETEALADVKRITDSTTGHSYSIHDQIEESRHLLQEIGYVPAPLGLETESNIQVEAKEPVGVYPATAGQEEPEVKPSWWRRFITFVRELYYI